MNEIRPFRSPPLPLLGVLALPFLMSCSTIEQRVEPVYDIRGSSVLVVPFRMGNYWYYESRDGNALARSLTLTLQEECGGLQTVTSQEVETAIHDYLDDPMPWAEFGRQVGADYVIVGEIRKIDFENPKMVGMLQGTIRAVYEVWEVASGRRTFTRQIHVKVPDDPESGQVYISFEQSRPEVQNLLMVRAGRQISGHLCGYDFEGRPR